MVAPVERFWSKVRKTQSCWLWEGTTLRNGYGHFYLAGKPRLAHRVSYAMHKGEPGKSVIQTCENRLCVNPEHLQSIDRTQRLQMPYWDEASKEWRVPASDGYAIVDEEALEIISQYNWHLSKGYAISGKGPSRVKMHRLLARHWGWEIEDLEVDHKNRVPHDNRRSNLRVCTHTDNCRNNSLSAANTSGHRGVYWHKRGKKWMASIGGKYLGLFSDKRDAIDAYSRAALQLYGEYSNETHK